MMVGSGKCMFNCSFSGFEIKFGGTGDHLILEREKLHCKGGEGAGYQPVTQISSINGRLDGASLQYFLQPL